MNDEKNKNKEQLNQLNILLETFVLTNNVYSINLKSISSRSFKIYFNRNEKIKALVELTNSIKRKKISLSKVKTNGESQFYRNDVSEVSLQGSDDLLFNNKREEFIILREITKPEEGEDIELCLRRNIFNAKEKIEANFDKFFQYKIKVEKVMKELAEELKSFCFNESDLLNKPASIEFPLQMDEEEFNYNNFLQGKNIKKYQKKIKSLIQEKFAFISYKSFNSPKIIQYLIDELILSSFDTTITKIFFMDKSNRLLSQRDCHTILVFLYIYCLTEDGLKNFCLGRNFRRIIKCFALHPKITLEFYFNIFKGIYLYNIDIKNHKKLSKIIDDLIDYLKKFEVNSVDREVAFKEEFHSVVKILIYLSNNLDLKFIQKLRIDLCTILSDKKIINQKKLGTLIPLYFVFSPDESKERDADDNIKMICQRFKFKENPFSEKNKMNQKDDEEKMNSSGESASEMFGDKENNEYDYDQSRALFELKKELLAKYLVKEKEIATRMQKLLKQENDGKSDALSMKKSPRKREKLTANKEINVFKDLRENEIDYLESLSNYDLNKLILSNEKFVFAFLDFISKTTIYVSRKNKVILQILGLFDLQFLAYLISRRYIKIKYRTIVIKFIHEIYLGEEIKNGEMLNELYPNSEEYYQIIQKRINDENKSKSNEDEDSKKVKTKNNSLMMNNEIQINEEGEEEEDLTEYENNQQDLYKLYNLNVLKTYLNFLINELDIIIKVLLDESDRDKLELGLPYLNELIFGLKLTGDIFISHDITSYIVLWFYELVKSFLCKSYFFKKYYENIKTHKSIEQIDFLKEDMNESFYVYEGDLSQKTFNIYNKEILFQMLLNEIYSFFKLTNFDAEFKIIRLISSYKSINDKEFHVMCLNNAKEGTGLLAEEKPKEATTKLKIRKSNDICEKYFQKLQDIINDYYKDFTF